MSITIEKTAKTVDEAIDKALSELNVSMDEADVEILETGSKGIFGLGGKDAKVRVTVKGKEEPLSFAVADQRKETESVPAPVKKAAVPTDDGEVEKIALNFLQGIFDYLKVTPDIAIERKEESLWLTMTGANLGVIIGRRGETLDSLQYLTNLVVNRKVAEKQRIILDVEGYRKTREETLRDLAEKMAGKALKMNGPLRLEPMNPHERRIIHMTLQGDERVETYSEGEEPFRRVVIKKKRHFQDK
ncbi:MAG: protein jag [Peptococcaceae bacterium]|jgi:spoIIIJ-associated protein|nr:protein jag [Peptococcaceae bacterium]